MPNYDGEGGGSRGKKPAYRIRCEWCWEVFRAETISALTCCQAHRSKLSRWRRAYHALTGQSPVQGPRGSEQLMSPLAAAIADGAPVAGIE